jgi:hypothetical protein
VVFCADVISCTESSPTSEVGISVSYSSSSWGSLAGSLNKASASFSRLPFLRMILKSPNSDILIATRVSFGKSFSLKLLYCRAAWSVLTVKSVPSTYLRNLAREKRSTKSSSSVTGHFCSAGVNFRLSSAIGCSSLLPFGIWTNIPAITVRLLSV